MIEVNAWFRFFFRKTYPNELGITIEEIDQLGEDFDMWMKENFIEDDIEKFYPKNLMDVALNSDKYFTHHGFHLGLAVHFFKYIEESAKKYETLMNDGETEG